MFALGNLLIPIAKIIDFILNILTWLIFIRAIISWVNPDPFNPIVQFLHRTTDPILEPLRRVIPHIGMIDISPLIAILIIYVLRSFLVKTLFDLAMRM